MKPLLFDQNLSPGLVRRLAEEFPNSIHVEQVGLSRALDTVVWEYARQHDCLLMTKDADFSDLGLLLGFPPKVIWIRRGNCSTRDIEQLLRENREAIASLGDDPDTGVLTLF